MKFTNETDQPVRFRRTHRFGDEQPTIVTVEPGKTLDVGHTYEFVQLEELPPPVSEDEEIAAIYAALTAAEAPLTLAPVTPVLEVVEVGGAAPPVLAPAQE